MVPPVSRLQQGDLLGENGIATALLAGSQVVCEALSSCGVSKVGMAQLAACPYAAPFADHTGFTEEGWRNRYRVEAALAFHVVYLLKNLNHDRSASAYLEGVMLTISITRFR